jgi:hypothetical protein
MRGDYAADIKRALTERLEEVVNAYFPSAVVRAGRAYPEPRSARDLGSFSIVMSGKGRGDWFRPSQGIGGDAVNLIAYAVTGNHKAYREGFAEAKRFLGGQFEPTARANLAPAPIKEKTDDEKRADAWRIWKGARPIVGSLAERYLKNRVRGLPDLAPYTALRFHPSVRYELRSDPINFPALIAAVTGPALRFKGVWRIFLNEAGYKAPVDAPKLGKGPCKGGAVWLGGEGGVVNVCEGIETGFGVRGFVGLKERVACLLSTAGMRGWEPPSFVKSVLIWPDGDRNRIQVTKQGERALASPGLSAAEALKDRLLGQGIACAIHPTNENGKDALDLWNEWHTIREQEET